MCFMAFLLARKIRMTQQYDGDAAVPVTVLAVDPCVVTQVRTAERDTYIAVQLGTGTRRALSKPMAGHVRDLGKFRTLREFRMDPKTPRADVRKADGSAWAVGDRIDASALQPGDLVAVSGISKGKGFQGVMRRHHFHAQDATHGTKDQHRMPGSIGGGGRAGGRVTKGMRMAGRMGGDRVTVQGLRVVSVDAERGEVMLCGAVPGARGALLEVRTWGGSWSS